MSPQSWTYTNDQPLQVRHVPGGRLWGQAGGRGHRPRGQSLKEADHEVSDQLQTNIQLQYS